MSLHTISGVELNLLLLIFLGFAVGTISGFSGAGGGFLMTPALIVLGLPASFATGTSLMWVAGNSIVGSFRHRELGNVDMKLAIITLFSMMSGLEIGVRLLNTVRDRGVANEAVLAASILVLLLVGAYTFRESMKRKKELDQMHKAGEKLPPPVAGLTLISRKLQSLKIPPMVHLKTAKLTMSLWVVAMVGIFIGTLAGFIGVGGGFIMVPSMVYIIGAPSFVAVGTNIFQEVFSASYGAIRHSMSGNVEIFTAFIMVLSASVGVQLGAQATKYLRGVSMRFTLSFAILFAAIGAILKLLYFTLPETNWLSAASIMTTFGGTGLVLALILWLFLMGLSYQRGRKIPDWAVSLVAREE